MRLEHIKLAGFKSFVDPTTVPFPSNLVAVVGPNGCGKSNIIDAVRWVMGESSAKQLRGESMIDVIFNGSSNRKPAGQASIELHFDNSDGGVGGQYAQYSEIVIRRQVNLDGQSSYYLNGVHCRRRDITDLFLGTGLGPRSYAIIEQGTISRLIEAKPEELRIYLEEAAGISKYKERRHETELRMQHTRDNLDRLTDLRDELQRQLDHLQKQAATAEKYQVLKTEERLLRAQLLVLRAKHLQQQSIERDAEIQQQELRLEALRTELQSLETAREKQQVQHVESNDEMQVVQREYYQLNTELAKIEQNLQHQRERRKQLQDDLQQAEVLAAEAKIQLDTENSRALQLIEQIAPLTPESVTAKDAAEQVREQLKIHEVQLQAWQQQWDEFNQQAATTSQRAQVEQTKIQHLDQHLLNLQQRLAKLQAEQEAQNQLTSPNIMTDLQNKQQHLQTQFNELQQRIADLKNTIQQQQDKNHQYNNELDKSRSQLQSLNGRLSSLTALQEAALGKNDSALQSWLNKQNLDKESRLAQTIQVEAGWETAVETVLGDYLEALCLPEVNQIAQSIQELTHGTLTIVTPASVDNRTHASVLNPLATKIQSTNSLSGLIGNIFVADNLQEALSVLNSLQAHESIITKEGIWLGQGWLRVSRGVDQKAGVLQRERELAQLHNTIISEQKTANELHQQLEQGKLELQTLEMQRDQQQQQMSQLSREQADVNAQLQVQQNKLHQAEQRRSQLTREQEELVAQQNQAIENLATTRHEWQSLLTQMQTDAEKRETLQKERDQAQSLLTNARNAAREAEEKAHALTLQLQVLQTQHQAALDNQQRLQQQLQQTVERQQTLQTQLAASDAPQQELEAQLQNVLQQQQIVEKALQEKRSVVEKIEEQLRDLEKQRTQVDHQIAELRTALEQQRLQKQSTEVRYQTFVEQLTEAGHSFEEVEKELPPEANDQEWDERLTKVVSRVERLGPINLAAISEYATQAERKDYLDKQHLDLTDALQTLLDAISKIDRETRARFKEVYDQVNDCFQTLFPRIFGGGSAYLELTGEDLLNTGVNVIARPPGKRNSTIHLLSGGEKALTAIALVFSIFQLNPAPFCMLDEVDAPLDDANIGRFCELVKEMSKTIQFIFISHNKLAIEMADHLTGVTMHEPGVSRLVAVDVEQAIAMAEH